MVDISRLLVQIIAKLCSKKVYKKKVTKSKADVPETVGLNEGFSLFSVSVRRDMNSVELSKMMCEGVKGRNGVQTEC